MSRVLLDNMFERYPEQSVRALFLARGAALADGTPSIESVHLLAGVLEVLKLAPVQHEAVMQQVGLAARLQPPGPGAPEIPFSDGVKAGLNAAVMIADTLGHHRIRPEHLLLALFAEGDSPVGHALRQSGLNREMLVASATREALFDDSPLPIEGRPQARFIL